MTASSDDRLLEELIWRLMRLPSIAAMRDALRTIPGLDSRKLRQAFDAAAIRLRDESRDADCELLLFVREQLREFLYRDVATEPPSDEIPDVETLLGVARGRPRALGLLALFRDHARLLRGGPVTELLGLASRPEASKNEQAFSLRVACVAALVAGTPSEKVKAQLVWGAWLREGGNLRAAERRIAKAAKQADQLGDTSLSFMVLGAQVGLYRMQRDLKNAVDTLRRMLVLAMNSSDRVMVLGTRKALAQCYRDLGRYAESLDQLNSLLPLLDDPLLTEQRLHALLLRGLVQEDLGRFDRGIKDHETAAVLAHEVGDRALEMEALINAAASFLKRGNVLEAYRRYSILMLKAHSWANPLAIGSLHNNLGQVLLKMGRPAEALTEFQKALGIKVNTRNKLGESIAFLGMGDALNELGNGEGAQTCYTLAMLGGVETGDAEILGMYASRMTHPTNAEDADVIGPLRWALNLARIQHYRVLELALVGALGRLMQGADPSGTVKLYQEALVQVSPRDWLAQGVPELVVDYSRLLACQPGGRPEALELLRRVVSAIEQEFREVLLDEQRSQIVTSTFPIYGALLEQWLVAPAPEDESSGNVGVGAFDLHEAAKGRSFLSDLGRGAIVPPAGIPEQMLQEEAELLTRERAIRYQDSARSEAQRLRQLGDCRAGLESCWARMQSLAPEYVRMRAGAPCSFTEVREVLRERFRAGVALVSFFCDESSTTAFVVRPDSPQPKIVRVTLGRIEIESVARQLSRTFNGDASAFPPRPPIRGDRPYERALSFFDDLGTRLSTVFEEVKDAEVLCLAPHGPLHLLPLHALRLADGDYLASHCAVVYCPSLSTLTQLLARQQPQEPRRFSVLAAGVAAEGDPNPDLFESDATIFQGLNCEATCIFGPSAAARARVLSDMSHHEVIHLSCHGYFYERNPLDSGLLLSDGHRRPPRNPWAVSPLERSRFILTVGDLRGSPLQAELVTLNACSTGLQAQRNEGDEFDGFTRAILLSGARAVMVNLWNVDQESSHEFLRAFYRNWLGGRGSIPKWMALHRAQREFLESKQEHLRHPYHWAPFTLTGDWR
jgi:tetratricopeptide (TPR) repeat protein